MNFLCELSTEGNIVKINFSPCTNVSKTDGIISMLDIFKPDNSSYWVTEFGGVQDGFTDNTIELRFGNDFMSHVDSFNELYDVENSMYIDETETSRKVYVNTPKYTWLYPDESRRNREVHYFSSSAIYPDNPSNNMLEGQPVYSVLDPPSFSVKLSDNYYGVILNQGFNAGFMNNNGFFDDEDKWNLFNSPVVIRKSSMENPAKINDFKKIREGIIESTTTKFNDFEVQAIDNLGSLNTPVCGEITEDMYPGHINITDKEIGKSIPVLFGPKWCKPMLAGKSGETDTDGKVTTTGYYYIIPEGVTQILTLDSVRDKDGNVISYSVIGRLIKTETEAETIFFAGYGPKLFQASNNDNTMRGIIEILLSKTRFRSDAYRNIHEWNKYTGPRLCIEFTGGTVKDAVNEVLKNDMAFLIQQPNGKFTIRQYGQEYAKININTTEFTKEPEKDFSNVYDKFFTTCNINWINGGYHYSGQAVSGEISFNKKVSKTFDTKLTSTAEAEAFAKLLGKRFAVPRQRIKVSLGRDVSEFQLLDTVIINNGENFNINGRVFSKKTNFYIVEINYAQDIIVLEEK